MSFIIISSGAYLVRIWRKARGGYAVSVWKDAQSTLYRKWNG